MGSIVESAEDERVDLIVVVPGAKQVLEGCYSEVWQGVLTYAHCPNTSSQIIS